MTTKPKTFRTAEGFQRWADAHSLTFEFEEDTKSGNILGVVRSEHGLLVCAFSEGRLTEATAHLEGRSLDLRSMGLATILDLILQGQGPRIYSATI